MRRIRSGENQATEVERLIEPCSERSDSGKAKESAPAGPTPNLEAISAETGEARDSNAGSDMQFTALMSLLKENEAKSGSILPFESIQERRKESSGAVLPIDKEAECDEGGSTRHSEAYLVFWHTV